MLVLPPLEGQLRQQKVDALEATARIEVEPLRSSVGRDIPVAKLCDRLERAAARSDARVVLLDVSSGSEGRGLTPNPGCGDNEDDSRFVLADVAVRSGVIETGTEPTTRGRVAEVAIPLEVGGEVDKIAVFTDDLEAVDDNVAFIRSRILVGGLVAFGLAVLAGYLVARALTARVRRLERAAHQVAEGDFSTRVRVDSLDELGRLAAAFDRMQRQLAALQTAREQFIATASHELRTPIFSLGGFLELLEDEELDEETRRAFIEQVRGQVQRLTKLTTELLDLSRLGSGAVTMRPEPTDLTMLSREVVAEFGPAANEHPVEVAAAVRGGRGHVRSGARRAGAANIDGQRARPHAARHCDPSERRARKRRSATCGDRCRTRASRERPCRTSSNPSSPPQTTAPVAQVSAWRSPPSSPSAWTRS